MKIEIGTERPANFNEYWPGQYEIFSHFEYVTGIPHVLFAVTTFKENGLPNVNFHSWSSFQGDGDGFFAILAGLYQHTHAFADILRSGEFCVNFLAAAITMRSNEPSDTTNAIRMNSEPAVSRKKRPPPSTHRALRRHFSRLSAGRRRCSTCPEQGRPHL